MIKGYAQRRLDRLAWELAVYDSNRKISYTVEFTAHQASDPAKEIPTTMISDYPEQIEMLKGFADALFQMGVIPGTATDAELKATKYHLEDMRKLVLK